MADQTFPCSISLSIPFPTSRLASIALNAIAVDKELSPLVRRSFTLEQASPPSSTPAPTPQQQDDQADTSVLRVEYRATTNRMLRVATNSFMESLSLVLEVMEKMDVGALEAPKGGNEDESKP